MEEQIIVENVVEIVMHKLFIVYFAQVIILIVILVGLAWLIFSGTLKKLFHKVITSDEIKVGKIELKGGGVIEDRRRTKRRAADVQRTCLANECAKYNELSKDISDIKTNVLKLDEHVDEIWTSNLKRDFYSKDLPLPESLLAGLTYVWWIEKHGKTNGDTKDDVSAKAWKEYDLYKMATIKNPELKIDEVENKYKVRSIK